jgi:hypothetical protein
MSDTSPTFVDLCLSGQATVDDIDDSVSRWHDASDSRPLHTFLGLSEDEYAIWVERPEALKFILFARRTSLSLEQALELAKSNGNGDGTSATGSSVEEAGETLQWFKKRARLATGR